MEDIKTMSNEAMLFEQAALSKNVEKFTEEFNHLPKKEREEGSARAQELLVLISAIHQRLIPITAALSKRIKESPQDFAFLKNIH